MTEQQLELSFDKSDCKPDTPTPKGVATDINDILTAPLTPPTTIIEGLLVSGESTMLCSIAGASKTFTSQYIASCITTGCDCFGMKVGKPQPVLYIDAELSTYQIQQRFNLIYDSLGKRPTSGMLKILHKRSLPEGLPDLATLEGLETIQKDIDAAKVLIIDNVSALYRSADEMSQNDWNFYNQCLDEWREQDKAILVLHHTDKSDRNYRGHSEIARAIDHSLIARKDKKLSNEKETVVTITNEKNRHSASRSDMFRYSFGSIGENGEFAFIRKTTT